ncbi:ABC transporter permease [Klebsiella pneumoniae]|uniref:ABC transporter permease n=1 Tax=Klebsiella pneumoniae TaxID=573 RepID=A0A377ZSH9_KLEPN|nr:ABC transporter permease [Klebsiella pneumoniae]
MGIERQYRRVVLVHSVHGLMYSVWICVAAFSAIDPLLARASRNLGAGPMYTFWHIVLPQAAPGIVAASIFVFLESLDEFTGTFFVGAPDITTLPLLLYNASMSGNYQVSSITALILLAPSLLFMVVIHKFYASGDDGQIREIRAAENEKGFPSGSFLTSGHHHWPFWRRLTHDFNHHIFDIAPDFGHIKQGDTEQTGGEPAGGGQAEAAADHRQTGVIAFAKLNIQ